MKKSKLFSFLMAGILAIAFITSCSEEEVIPPDAPTIAVSVDGMVDGQLTATLGDDVVISISAVTDGGFASLTITEYQGTTELNSEVSTTPVASYTHTVTPEDASEPFRVNFMITDNEGLTASTDIIISGVLTDIYKLQNFNWQYTSQMGILEGETESIKDCEKDNVYTFNEDGTASLDFGTDTKVAPCELDGLILATGYTYDEETKVLTILQDEFQPDWSFAPGDSKVYTNVTFDGLTFTGRTQYDLSALFGLDPGSFMWDADESYTAVEK